MAPRFSIAAGKASRYLPIVPGTDLALILAWMHVLVTESLYDKAFVEQHGFGFDAFATTLAPYTPEWAYPETGIEPQVIRETAREMARDRPATLVHPGRRTTWYGDDTQRSRAISAHFGGTPQVGAAGQAAAVRALPKVAAPPASAGAKPPAKKRKEGC